MAGLDPAIHVFVRIAADTWMPGSSPGMTMEFDEVKKFYRPI